MPRPISWLPRLHEIRRSVANSVRSHYGRRDLEQLFELQPRAAQKLFEMLPTVKIGTSLLVEREALVVFLDRVREAEDVGALFEQVRAEKAGVSRKKVRALVPRDTEPATLSSLPESIALSRGRLEVSFATVEQLAEAMFALARVLETDVDAFAQAYEPEMPPEVPEVALEIDALFAELEAMERERSERTVPADHSSSD
ncbi:hypothetical protein HDF16_005734 [Granulicella aggregans]|uniref:Uncharacterized protein n=1 Tax=Granulicella aggregans TaxID=474949 RepID=A0A7W7ZJF4_9BACT|nr:hypothetical protein [Granulicella aggregans]MBB5060998.1 hypothetical protein [Granulicella aggregans]